MISREKFKDYLDIIRDLSDKEAKFNDILAELGDKGNYAFIYSKPIITMTNMILSLDNKRK